MPASVHPIPRRRLLTVGTEDDDAQNVFIVGGFCAVTSRDIHVQLECYKRMLTSLWCVLVVMLLYINRFSRPMDNARALKATFSGLQFIPWAIPRTGWSKNTEGMAVL